MYKILFVFGTRPEAIKLVPLIDGFKKLNNSEIKICVTAQHREMLDQILRFFNIIPDYDLNIMTSGQSLPEITSKGIMSLDNVLRDFDPDNIVVQGDTSTAFIGALSGYYRQIPVTHIEAGLRSGNKYSPFPEEGSRILVDHLADYYFAPTQKAAKNLKREGISKNVWVVGNTVIDALLLTLDKIRIQGDAIFANTFGFLDLSKRVVLITGHRRESFGQPLENICLAIKRLAENFPEDQFVYPVHLNPNVQRPVKEILGGRSNVFLIEPLEYPALVWLLSKSYIVLTDSGGIQEEAPTLGKPVLILRDVTERIEGIDAGVARLVGTDVACIIKQATRLLTNSDAYQEIARVANPYGDGKSASKIVKIYREFIAHEK